MIFQNKFFRQISKNKSVLGFIFLSLCFVACEGNEEEVSINQNIASIKVSSVNAEGNIALGYTDYYSYDSQNRLVTVESKDTDNQTIRETSVTYNNQGEISKYGLLEVTSTNENGKPLTAIYNQGSGFEMTYNYVYNDNGQLIERNTNDGGVVTFSYHSSGKLKQIVASGFAPIFNETINFDYDNNGNFTHNNLAEFNDKVAPNWYIFDNNFHYYYEFGAPFSSFETFQPLIYNDSTKFPTTIQWDTQFANNLLTAYNYAENSNYSGREASMIYEYDENDRPVKITMTHFQDEIEFTVQSEITYVE